MIPLRDDIRSRAFPVMTWAIIALNCLVFMFELILSPQDLVGLVNSGGMVPAGLHLTQPLFLLKNPQVLLPLFSSLFLHHGWFHLVSNMWALAVFGKSLEDRLGPRRFLSFYVLAGLAANLLYAQIYPQSHIPAIGASGAVAGILGGYLLCFPVARVLTLVPLVVIPWFLRLRAVLFLGFWFFAQLFSGLFSLSLPAGANLGGTAWWAHTGGFLFGIVAARFFTAWEPAGDHAPER
jgi:membrane associated rhomboid family serine protease